jgi:hypothetical protein
MANIARWVTFELEFLQDAKLPKWKGRLIRGFLGMLLKRTYCRAPGLRCEECPLNPRCPYGYLYRSTSPILFLRKIKYFPKPFALKPPLEQKQLYHKGDILRFSLVLFGRANEFLLHIINALIQGSSLGIGIRGHRGRYILRRIYLENPFREKKELLYEDGSFYNSRLWISFRDLERNISKEFTLEFLTPFRILKDGALIAEPKFSYIFPFMMRKYSNILRAHCGIALDENFRELKELSEQVETLAHQLKAVKFIYTRNNKKYIEYYLIGRVKFRFPNRLRKDVRRIINFGSLSNIGKRTTFGHGWYIIAERDHSTSLSFLEKM